MTAFDYLHAPQPAWVSRVGAIRVPSYLHSALAALFFAVFIVTATWAIESHRLHAALTVQQIYEVRLERSRTDMERTKVLYGRLERLAAIDRQVHEIERSGDLDAKRLAEIADRLPPHAWLTSIARDSDGIALEGRARDLAAVSRTVRALATARLVANPVLVNLTSESDFGGQSRIRYQLHLDGTDK